MGTLRAIFALAFLLAGYLAVQGEEMGFQPQVQVKQATRLDWEFVAGAEASKLPASYDSRRQRYQLFVPANYKADRIWPLVLFISPGDDPLGWKVWQKPCEEGQFLFCAAYGAGNGVSLPRRIRLILDMLDDIRHRYRINPDRTYLAGLGGGAPLACAIGFTLPEHFGGIIAIGGGADLPALAHLRHRVRDRLSIALVSGESDFARRDLEHFFAPLLTDLGIRSRLWIVPGAGHGLPPDSVLSPVLSWLELDQKRRHEEDRLYPGLSASADEITPRRLLASRALTLAENELNKPGRTFHAVALLEWITIRCERTEGAEKAAQVLKEIQEDPVKRARLADQTMNEESKILSARARAFERSGEIKSARDLFQKLATAYPASPEGKKAIGEVGRLTQLLANTPYLGAALEEDTPTLREAVAGSPAQRGGLQAGDRIVQIGERKIVTSRDIRLALAGSRPGDKVPFTLQRGGKSLTLTISLGNLP